MEGARLETLQIDDDSSPRGPNQAIHSPSTSEEVLRWKRCFERPTIRDRDSWEKLGCQWRGTRGGDAKILSPLSPNRATL